MSQHKINFTGSYLGYYEWGPTIRRYWVVNPEAGITPKLIVQIKIQGFRFYAWMSRIRGESDDCMIDELKNVFGLVKLGTHRLTIQGCPQKISDNYPWFHQNIWIDTSKSVDYLISPAIKTGRHAFLSYPRLIDVKWYPDSNVVPTLEQKQFFFEIQKILLFRELFRISTPNLESIRIRSRNEVFTANVPISCGTHKIREIHLAFGGIHDSIERVYFPFPESKGKTLAQCLDLTPDNYQEKLTYLRIVTESIVEKLNPQKIWICNHMYESCLKLINLYFSILRIRADDILKNDPPMIS